MLHIETVPSSARSRRALSSLCLQGGCALPSVPEGNQLSRKTMGTIKGKLFWAFAYNTAGIPIAAAAMAFRPIFVVSNSLRLRGAKVTP